MVEVMAYDARWVKLYQSEAAAIRAVLGEYALGLEHIGSTAVPGLMAKPIVDILIGAHKGSEPRIAMIGLGRLGYEYLGEDGRRPGRYFWRKRGTDAFNVSVVPYRGAMWESNLAVRDFLRTHPGWVERYGQIKLRAADASETSMLGYQNHKREFVDELRHAALAWVSDDRSRTSRVILICGPAGAGKSTVAHRLEEAGMVRLSFDQEAWNRGIRSMPLPAWLHQEIEDELRARLVSLVEDGVDVVLDFSFWSRHARDEYRQLLKRLGVEAETMYLATSREVAMERT